MSLLAFGAGFPRTGTSSLKVALQHLDHGPCMHMEDLFNDPDRVDYWVELYDTGTTDFTKLFAGYRSTTDIPGCLLYRELLAQYPDLKVILNYRDPEVWYDSMLETVYPAVPKTPAEKAAMQAKGEHSERFRNIAKTLAMVEVYLLQGYFAGEFTNRERTLERYRAHYDAVRAGVLAGQLLEYEVSQGWEPLADFLGVPVPDAPFPRRNQRADFKEQIGKMLAGGGKLKLK